MLPCVCSVIDHRWRQNVLRTKKWHTRRSWVCHWCSYHILTSSVIRRTATWNLFDNNERPFNITWKPAFCPAFARKKPIWRDLWSIRNEAISLVAMRSKELWLVEKNHATVKPDASVAPRGITYSESRIELWNLQILKKMLEKSSQFLSSEQPCEPKSLDVALKVTEVEKILSENLWLSSTYKPSDSSFEWKEREWRWGLLSSVVGDSQISLI